MQLQPDQAKKARKDKLRAAQLTYLDKVMRETGMTPTEIARLYDGDHSTLTRFRNKAGYNGTLQPRTIELIAEKTGIAAPIEAIGKRHSTPPSLQEVIAERTGPETEAEPYIAPIGDNMAGLVTAAVNGRVHVVPWTLRTRALEDEGYLPGDILIVDLHATPQAKDIVCAQIYDWDRKDARTVFRLFHPPFLVGAGREDGARVPQIVDNTVELKGVVELILRRPRRG